MKNNKFVKAICILFTVVFLFSTVACKKGLGSSTPESSIESSEIKNENVIGDSKYWLVKDGKTDYAIIYPETQESNENMILAVSELQGLVLEATGVTLPAYSDADKKTVNKIISLGKTEQAINHSTLLNDLKQAEVKSEGYIIKTVNDSVYLLGNSTISIVYAVYEFLEYQFGFECYAKDEYALESNVKDKALKAFDLIDIPDFESRSLSNWDTLSTRLRTRVYGTEFNTADNNFFVHNSLILIPPEKYMAEHEEWFYYYAPYNQYQICYTAHGNSEELELLAQTIFEEMRVRLIAQPEIDWISFCHEDVVAWCDCESCTKDYKLYDQVKYTASYANAIRLINKVAKRMKEWNQTECPDREIVIFLWEYDQITYAPVKLDENKKPIKDENGNYMPYSDDLVLEENVGIYWCGSFVRGMMMTDNSKNQAVLDKLNRTKAIMTNPIMFFWLYSTYFGDYLMPYNNVNRQEWYRYATEYGARGMFDQAQFDNETSPDFGILHSYVTSKLMWNVDEDVDTLVNNFFINYYKDAAKPMRDMYEFYTTYLDYLANEKGYDGDVGAGAAMKNTKYWPWGVLEKFLSYIDKAYEAIAPLKSSDYDLYYKLYVRIKRESLSFRYLQLSLYPQRYNINEITELKLTLRSDCIECGMTQRSENNSINNLFGEV